MKDVLFKSPNSSPCHCTTHPLLGNGVQPRVQHYVSSPYQVSGSGGSHSPPTSSTPTAEADCSWTAEPVYEELPSGAFRFHASRARLLLMRFFFRLQDRTRTCASPAIHDSGTVPRVCTEVSKRHLAPN